MCDKLYLKQGYCNPRYDKCLISLLKKINKLTPLKTIASCCGHGKYMPTIVVRTKEGQIFELFSRTKLVRKKRNRYYKTDKEKYYYIPEVLANKERNTTLFI